MRPIQTVLALLLMLSSSAAMALGLGNIRVLSRPGQPLLAEIPVISSDPDELANARVGLASPATFERVGLAPPAGLVSELQFAFAQDAQGRAVVRVTSTTPVQVPAVGFLIEVDWGQGRLVREYSALVSAPETAAAVAEPVVEAPATPDNLIVREPEPLPAEPAETPAPVPVPSPQAPPAVPATAPPAPGPLPATTQVDGELAPVQRGQVLSRIAGELARGNGHSLDQTMLALLRANPDAFIRGNVNLLRQGAVLRVPGQDELEQVSAAEARAIVREHTAQWRQARAPIPQPEVAGTAAASGGEAAAAPAANGARLEIAPAVAGGQQSAGTMTGLDAGGEGDMAANEQLRQAREDIATRDAELQELRERVVALEKLQEQQQSLIAMKDSDLAAAQQRLADAAKQESPASMPWAWLGLVLVLLAGAAWWLSRRRKPSPLSSAPRGTRPTPGFALAMPAAEPAADEMPDDEQREVAEDTSPESEPEPEPEPEAVPFWSQPAPAAETTPEPDEQVALLSEVSRPAGDPVETATEAAVPPRPAAVVDSMARVAPLNPAPAGRERLELAIAYLDLGDAETARTLLNEVVTGADPKARDEALELLARLG
ncbi:FimV protein [uncultured Stenotrophomonas sp.]|uniref:FimV protein n=1 Tax=uncultured Stenotrophomonas sp. TaxID=165438 RepID=A0A1Y5Q205_9GAMM|nr:FimV protein [uncultured Stenotrophomonas sp.]